MQICHLKTAIKKTEQSIKPNVLDCTHQYTSTIYIANGVVVTKKDHCDSLNLCSQSMKMTTEKSKHIVNHVRTTLLAK